MELSTLQRRKENVLRIIYQKHINAKVHFDMSKQKTVFKALEKVLDGMDERQFVAYANALKEEITPQTSNIVLARQLLQTKQNVCCKVLQDTQKPDFATGNNFKVFALDVLSLNPYAQDVAYTQPSEVKMFALTDAEGKILAMGTQELEDVFVLEEVNAISNVAQSVINAFPSNCFNKVVIDKKENHITLIGQRMLRVLGGSRRTLFEVGYPKTVLHNFYFTLSSPGFFAEDDVTVDTKKAKFDFDFNSINTQNLQGGKDAILFAQAFIAGRQAGSKKVLGKVFEKRGQKVLMVSVPEQMLVYETFSADWKVLSQKVFDGSQKSFDVVPARFIEELEK